MFRRIVVYICSLLLFVFPAGAEGLSRERKAVKVSGDVLLAAMPVATVATVLAMKDWTGAKQGLFTGVTTLGVSYLLKFTVKKDRPDHSNRYSFPSAHTSLLFANAAFVQRRYGWKWGAPAYVLASYVGWSRVYGRKHDWWDVAVGAVIGAGCAYIYTRPFAQNHRLVISPLTDGNSFGVYASMIF